MSRRNVPFLVLSLLAMMAWSSAFEPAGAASQGAQDFEVHDGGFTVAQSYEIDAEPMSVYRTLVDRVGEYWHPDHTFSGSSANLYIEDRPGGCFCESLENDGFVRHLDVIVARPGSLLRLGGGLGPLGEHAVTGALSLALQAADGGTSLTLTYRVSGHVPQGFATWAEPVSGVLRQQVERLVRLVETGSPEPGEAAPGTR